jgi:hypothetical protein
MFYPHPNVMLEKGISWLNVQCVEEKSLALRRLGRWLANRTKAARGPNSQSDFSNTAERPSDPPLGRERSRLAKAYHIPYFFSFFRAYMSH